MAIRQPTFSIAALERGDVAASKENKRLEPKEFIIKRGFNGLFSLSYTAGGEVPDGLKGFYTSAVKAEHAAEVYLRNRDGAQAGS